MVITSSGSIILVLKGFGQSVLEEGYSVGYKGFCLGLSGSSPHLRGTVSQLGTNSWVVVLFCFLTTKGKSMRRIGKQSKHFACQAPAESVPSNGLPLK